MLLPGFSFDDVQGCVDLREMGISFGMDDAELKHRLNELKDTLILEYGLSTISQARWERHRDKFISTVREIAASTTKDKIIGTVTYQKIRHGGDIDTRTIARMCKFFDCQPGDLLDYVPDGEDNKKESED